MEFQTAQGTLKGVYLARYSRVGKPLPVVKTMSLD